MSACEIDAQRSADARRRPRAAKLLATIDAATAARVRSLPIDRLATRDVTLETLDRERGKLLALLEGGACAPDLTEAEARAALVRCGLIPAAGPDQPGPSADAAPAVAGAPESLAGAPVPPSRLGVADVRRHLASIAAPVPPEPIRWTGAPITPRCSRCQVRASETAGMCWICADAESDDFARECAARATTGGATAERWEAAGRGGDLVFEPGSDRDPIWCQTAEQADLVAAALNAYRTTAATSSAANAEPDPTKAEVEIHGRRVTLYLVAGADGRERWISEPVSPQKRSGWASSAYRIALIGPRWPESDDECIGRTMPLGTIPARHRKHAENRARNLGARLT